MTGLGFLLFSIFLILAILHFYWAAGGKWGLNAALPANEQGKPVLTPGPLACMVVGIGLSAFAVFYLIKSGTLQLPLPNWLLQSAGWIIPSVFLLRAIGDRKFVGFFKTIKDTEFGRMDTKFFAPLCLFLAVTGYLIQSA